ncbi:hypothetical protein DL769_000976 [Monosporascus sp. CRB-8-3]|nr:hypothetical protein DL769_000976 [Monosporascus sp. CRB-8-3]
MFKGLGSIDSVSWGKGFTASLDATAILRLLSLWLAYRLFLALYNISPFHPLHRFPGPKLAAASFIYEFWFDAIKGGRYGQEIKRLHDIYGPIVRINPEELHCIDPDFIDEIYTGPNRRRDKQQHFLNIASGPLIESGFATVDHDLHHIRKGALARYFSRGQMLRLEPEVRSLVNALCDKLLRSTGEPLDITTAYSCLTSDTITQYAFGDSTGFVAQPGWEPNYRAPLRTFLDTVYVWKFFPFLSNIIRIAPYIAKYISGDVGLLMREMFEVIPARIQKAIEARERGEAQANIWTDMLESPLLPPEEKTAHRLAGDGFALMFAGTETTAAMLTLITYYLLAQPATRQRLIDEIKDVDPRNLSWVALEQRSPYLGAVILEGLRLGHGLSSRAPRIPRDEDLVYRKGVYEYVIPRGTPIGMTSVHVHLNEDIFPDAEKFMPERWLDENGQRRRDLEKYLMAYSRGSRMCQGINFANCVLYLVTAAITLRVMPRMSLYKTTEEDVKYDHDLALAQPKKGTTGVWVTIS